jgi:hypothetical protein
VFGAVVSFIVMVHAVRRFDCVRASASTAATTPCTASLGVLIESLVEGPRVCLL